MQQPSASTLLGQNVERLRQEQGWSVDRLATRLDWPREKLVALESGILDLDLDGIDQLSEALKTPPHQLFDAGCEDVGQLSVRRYA